MHCLNIAINSTGSERVYLLIHDNNHFGTLPHRGASPERCGCPQADALQVVATLTSRSIHCTGPACPARWERCPRTQGQRLGASSPSWSLRTNRLQLGEHSLIVTTGNRRALPVLRAAPTPSFCAGSRAASPSAVNRLRPSHLGPPHKRQRRVPPGKEDKALVRRCVKPLAWLLHRGAVRLRVAGRSVRVCCRLEFGSRATTGAPPPPRLPSAPG